MSDTDRPETFADQVIRERAEWANGETPIQRHVADIRSREPYVGGHPEMPLHPFEDAGDGTCSACTRARNGVDPTFPGPDGSDEEWAEYGTADRNYYRDATLRLPGHWQTVRYLDDDGDGYGGVPFVALSEVEAQSALSDIDKAARVERRRDAQAAPLGGLADVHPYTCRWCDGEWRDYASFDAHFPEWAKWPMSVTDHGHPHVNPRRARVPQNVTSLKLDGVTSEEWAVLDADGPRLWGLPIAPGDPVDGKLSEGTFASPVMFGQTYRTRAWTPVVKPDDIPDYGQQVAYRGGFGCGWLALALIVLLMVGAAMKEDR